MRIQLTSDGLRLTPESGTRLNAARAELRAARKVVQAGEATNFLAALANAEAARSDRSAPLEITVEATQELDDEGTTHTNVTVMCVTADPVWDSVFHNHHKDELEGLFSAACEGDMHLGSSDWRIDRSATDELAATGDLHRFLCAVTAADPRARHDFDLALREAETPQTAPQLIYLTNALGEPTGYGTVPVTAEMLQRVPFEEGPGFVLTYLVEISGEVKVIGNLELRYVDDAGKEPVGAGYDVVAALAAAIAARVQQRVRGDPAVRVLPITDDGQHLIIPVLVPVLDTVIDTGRKLMQVFGSDAELPGYPPVTARVAPTAGAAR